MLKRLGDETAVQPSLVYIADVEPEDLGDTVVVDAERPAHVDREAVDILAAEPGIIERRLEGDKAELKLAFLKAPAELAEANAGDGGLVADKPGHGVG